MTDTKINFSVFTVAQVDACNADLQRCIDEWEYIRGGNGALSCDPSDAQMVSQLTVWCEEFIVEQSAHFSWIEMKVLVIPDASDDD